MSLSENPKWLPKWLPKWSLLLCLFVSTWVAANQRTAGEIQAMIAKQPEAALAAARSYWQDRSIEVENLDAGLLLVNALLAEKQYSEAELLLEQFLQLSELSQQQRAVLLAKQLTLFRESKSTDDHSDAIKNAEDLLAELLKSEPEGPSEAIYALSRSLGLKYYFEGAFDRAEPLFQTVMKFVGDEQHQQKSDALNTYGVIKAQQADLPAAAEYMVKSLQVLEQNDLTITPMRYQNLGSLYFMLKDWDKSIVYSQQALALQDEENATTASLYSNLGAAYVEKGELELATTQLNKSIAISENLGTSTASAHNNLGYIYNQMGAHDKALSHLNQSKAEYIKSGNEQMLSLNHKSIGDVYLNMQDPQQALSHYEQSLALHEKHDFKSKRLELYPKMVSALEQVGDYRRAYELMVTYKALSDEINSVEATKKVNELLAGFEVEKKEQALAASEAIRLRQSENIALLEHKQNVEEKIRFLMLLLVVGLILILLLVWRSWRFRGKANQLLLDKNQRIESQRNQLESLNQQLKSQTEVDAMTGLKNRRFVTEMVAMEAAKKSRAAKQWCLIIIDLDDFKQINDQYGHHRGDEVLIQFGQCLMNQKGPNDVVARWGGEEFLWLAEIQSVSAGAEKCNEFQQALDSESWFRGNETRVTCSMGFSAFPLLDLNFEDWEAALKLADYALYHAKKAGKNQWFGFKTVDPNLNYSDINEVDLLIESQRLQLFSKGSPN